jgi:hypothetical protein
VLADFNRDGRLDVVSQCDVDCTPQVYFGDGAGGLTPGPPIEPPAQGRAIAAGDINGDGYPDLLFEISGNNGVNVMLGGPNGFRRVDESGLSVLERFEGFALADLNGDGHLDVVLNESRGSEYASVVLVFLGRGDGTFDGGQFTLVPGAIAVADVNHDGLPDIVGYSVNALHVLVNTRGAVNHPPVVPDYATSVTYPCFAVGAEASDPEQHALFVSWFDASGAQVDAGQGAFTFMRQCVDRPGVYRYRRTATDMRGSSASGSVTVTVGPGTELYMYAVPPPFTAASESETYRGNWLPVADPTAAGGFRAYNPNAGMPKTAQPDGVNYVQLGFSPDPSLTYKLWIRLKADGNSWSNDSVWVEMSDATDTAGNAVGPFAVNLEECSGCGESGWGWEDDGWGAVNRNGRLFQFPNGGFQTIRISTREDGVSIDQIVLSAQKYLTRRPGAAKNDGTILPRTSGWIGW